MNNNLPIVLTIGGHDPTGGAGITADIENISSKGCYPLSLISCLTSQNTYKYEHTQPVDPLLFSNQANILISDIRINMVKIGVLPSLDIIEKIKEEVLDRLKGVKVIVDPIIKSSTGGIFLNRDAIEGLKTLIFPKSFLITPNLEEIKILSGKKDLASAVNSLFSFSPEYILVKDIKESEEHILNHLYSKNGLEHSWSHPRLKGNYHGTGCYLASSIACFLALSNNIEKAIDQAQLDTIKAVRNSIKIGKGLKILKRNSEQEIS